MGSPAPPPPPPELQASSPIDTTPSRAVVRRYLARIGRPFTFIRIVRGGAGTSVVTVRLFVAAEIEPLICRRDDTGIDVHVEQGRLRPIEECLDRGPDLLE